MRELLIKLNACEEAKKWAGDKSWEEVYNTCHRGDWLLWLHNRTNKEDVQVRTLAKGHCANTVRHLMEYKISLVAVDTAIAFGEGRATRDELDDVAYDAAYTAEFAAASTYATYAAANAAAFAAANNTAANNTADTRAAYAAAAAYRVAAEKIKNQKDTADIVRKYIPIELWNTQKMIDELKTK